MRPRRSAAGIRRIPLRRPPLLTGRSPGWSDSTAVTSTKICALLTSARLQVPNDTRPSSAPAALHSPANAPAETPPSSSSSSSSASSPSPASSSSDVPAKMPDIVPVWASSKRLDEANVDFRVPTELFVELTVDKRACRAPSVMSRMYREGAASKCSAAAALLGDSKEEGFRVVAPVLPRAMLPADAATFFTVVGATTGLVRTAR